MRARNRVHISSCPTVRPAMWTRRYSNGLDPKVEHVDTEAVQLRTRVLHEYDHHIALCGVLPDVGQEEKREISIDKRVECG